MPVRADIEPATLHAIEQHVDGAEVELIGERGLPVDVARARLWSRLRSLSAVPDVVIWSDADAFWLRGTVRHLFKRFTALGDRVAIGSFHGKRRAFSDLNAFAPYGGGMRPIRIAEARAAEDGLTESAFIGMHFLAHRPALLPLLGENPFAILPGEIGEDHSFCARLRERGCRLVLDVHLPVFHVEGDRGYLPGKPPFIYAEGGMIPTDEAPPPSGLTEQQVRSYGGTVDAIRRQAASLAKNSPGREGNE